MITHNVDFPGDIRQLLISTPESYVMWMKRKYEGTN